MSLKKKLFLFLDFLMITGLITLDQYTKYLASAYLKGGHSIVLIENVFQLHYLENRGAAFGVLQGKKLWFVAITVFMLAAMLLVYFRAPKGRRFRWLRPDLVLLTAGAIGSLVDRLSLDYVIDFFYFELPQWKVSQLSLSDGSRNLFRYVKTLIYFSFFYFLYGII